MDMSATRTAKPASTPDNRLKINGELVILGADGRLSFDALQRRLVHGAVSGAAPGRVGPGVYAAFDVLAFGGVDLRTQRWSVRRTRLEQLAAGGPHRAGFTDDRRRRRGA